MTPVPAPRRSITRRFNRARRAYLDRFPIRGDRIYPLDGFEVPFVGKKGSGMNKTQWWGLGFFAAAGAAACVFAPAAGADTPQQVTMGSEVDLPGGQAVEIKELEPSSDAIPYRPTGTLWEAEATIETDHGGAPLVPGFSAQAGAVRYPVLWTVPTAKGVNPATLPPGGEAEGKIYFDVTGPAPDAVVYTFDGRDVATWLEAPNGAH